MRLGRYAEAVEALQQAVRFGPDSSEYGSTLGEAYLKLKDYEKARQAGEAAVKVRPVFFKAYWILASAYAGLGQEAKALECRQRFGELDTQHRERQWRTAANDAEMAVSNTTFTHTGIGRVYRRLGRPEKARELWHRAAVLRPRDLPSRLELAGLDMELGQYPEVLALSEEITRIDPHSPFGPLFAGHAYAALRRADEAEAAYRKAMDLAPALPDGYAGLARLRLKTGRDLAEAKLLASTAVQLAPLPQNLAVLGEACGRNGDLQGARAAYERALKLAPGNPEIRKAYEELARRP
jgi:tetratricopeptide (TPR) repeat protein